MIRGAILCGKTRSGCSKARAIKNLLDHYLQPPVPLGNDVLIAVIYAGKRNARSLELPDRLHAYAWPGDGLFTIDVSQHCLTVSTSCTQLRAALKRDSHCVVRAERAFVGP